MIGHIGSQINDETFSIEDFRVIWSAAFGEDQRGARDLTREGGGGKKKGEETQEERHGDGVQRSKRKELRAA